MLMWLSVWESKRSFEIINSAELRTKIVEHDQQERA